MPVHSKDSHSVVDLARGFGGAIIFSFPMLMTMEMWWLGFSMSGLRMALFILVVVPLLIGLSYFDGFEDTVTLFEDIREALEAFAIGFVTAAVMLFIFGVITTAMSFDEIVGKLSVQAVVGAFGAMLAQSLFGGSAETVRRKRSAGYWGQVFLTLVGAIFLSMSVAPTEEMYLISYQMSYWHIVVLMVLTLLAVQGFLFAAEQRGQKMGVSVRTPWWSLLLRYSFPAYALALLVSAYVLWTFGSLDGHAVTDQLKVIIVLSFPAGVGGAASRLIL